MKYFVPTNGMESLPWGAQLNRPGAGVGDSETVITGLLSAHPREGNETKELYVSAKDQPGEMNKIAEALGRAGVNMLALCAYNIDGTGRIHFVVNDHDKGKLALQKLKYKVMEDEVLILELKHSPGELARVTGILSKSGVNIDLVYGSGSTFPSAQLVLKVSDLKKAEKALGLE